MTGAILSTPNLTIAHISDLHFSKVQLGPMQLFSKRWIGNLNVLFNRGKIYQNDVPETLIGEFKKNGVTHVLISGDVSTTSYKAEFKMAKQFVDSLKKEGFEVFVIPGNHDAYTKRSFRKKLFYNYFDDEHDPKISQTLKDDQVSAIKIGNGYWLVRLDTTYPAPVYLSTGRYTDAIDQKLNAVLSSIPQNDKVILMNHFPMFHHEHPRRVLFQAEKLRKTLNEYSNIEYYVHGHTHKNCVADLRESKLPIILDSGSCSHVKKGSWNLIKIYEDHSLVETYTGSDLENNASWKIDRTFTFKPLCQN